MFYKIKNQKGATLLELIISIGIFTVALLIATTIFKTILEGQRAAIASQNTQESIRFFFEIMSKEIRMAKGDHAGSPCGADTDDNGTSDISPAFHKVYNNENNDANPGNELYFQNKDDECVGYRLRNGRIQVFRESGGTVRMYYLTPDEVTVSNLEFIITDDPGGGAYEAVHTVQPRVTVKMDIDITGGNTTGQAIKAQTTLSSRYYE